MGFIRMKGVTGLVYVPDDDGGAKKHPCPDCHFCQWCSDNRCALCLEGKACARASEPGDDRPGKACARRKKRG